MHLPDASKPDFVPWSPAHRVVRILTYALVLSLLAVAPAAQKPRGKNKDAWKTDPYTKKDPEAMAAAGYVSFGPFTFGDGHDSAMVDHVIGEQTKLIWVETAHFKIGSSLPEYKIPRGEKKERDKLKKELDQLKKKLPTVKPKTKKLDRWLRLHLFAQRIEDTYADFCKRMGVTDADFPAADGNLVNGKYMGRGPYLGQQAKYTVLLFGKKSTAGHYQRNFLREESDGATRHNFLQTGSLLYLTSTEFAEGSLQNDTALHCEAVFNVVHGLIDGYRYFSHSVPFWFRQGLAHWYLRQVSPKYNVYGEYVKFSNNPKKLWDWPPRVRSRVKFDHFPPAAEILTWKPGEHETLIDNMMLWSRVDYLMTLGDDKLRKYIHAMKQPFQVTSGLPTEEQILERQKQVMMEAWELTPARYDEQWKAWVLATYPKK